MDIRYPFILILGKIIILFSRLFNIGNGGTWPGEIALRIDPQILNKFFQKLNKGVILIAGTNGKTTTSFLTKQILTENQLKVISNSSGANLMNGIVSAFIQTFSFTKETSFDWGVFETDENSLPAVISNIQYPISNENKQLVIILLNLFRDQLDRYGEVDVIAEKWEKSIKNLDKNTVLILNADDPQIAYLGNKTKARTKYFGLKDTKITKEKMEHATDSIYCLKCGKKLSYISIYYSHVGNWYCNNCKFKRPELDLCVYDYPLPGIYNRYNILASVLASRTLGLNEKKLKKSVSDFKPAFGRQEEIDIDGKKVKIFLSKNPASFNESLRTIISVGAKQILFVLNDRIPDGCDVSWIWDVDFDQIPFYITPVVSGDRVYDMALAIKYSRKIFKFPINAVSQADTPIITYDNLNTALKFCLGIDKSETLYILATYSAMLEVRKILKGRKIL
jgi:UDP-N-acetylmuramyl tripeptide synthase